jgi:L-threonylcarbamoyladenylate synthase
MVARAADQGSFDLLAKTLSRGGVAIIPCDTMYGFVGVAPDTDERIRRIKGRGETKPFLQLIARPSWVERVSDFPVPPMLSKYWPGPLTIIFPAREGGTVALRLPDSPFLQRLMEEVGQPIFSTSVNRTGKDAVTEVAVMIREFEREVDLIYDAGNLPPGPPSTLVDVTVRPFRVVRPGAAQISPEDLA